ncbi:MAG: exodeoxyribonuclease III [Bacteroidota bacterium]
MKIISYNINGIRAALKKGFADWIAANDFDLICVQETKALREQADLSALEALGYQSVWHSAQKKGYSGVATFYKTAPKLVAAGMGIEKYDAEGRVLRTDFDSLTVLNCYFPSGSSGDIRQGVKMEFLKDFQIWMNELRQQRKHILVVGDYNIAHQEIDIHDPVRNKKNSGFLPEEREWMTKWFDSGFIDTFRDTHPTKVQYSWWSYRAGARAKNKGWRIDYQSITDNMQDKIVDAFQMTDVVHSDHCPVFLELERGI